MAFFRRKETLNEKLMREAGLANAPAEAVEPDEPPPDAPAAARAASPPDVYDPVIEGRMFTSAYGPLPSRQGDAIAWAQAPQIRGDEVRFYVLADGSLIVDEEEGEAALDPLANAIEDELRPPYVAHGTRRDDGWWLVTGSRVEVLELDAPGEDVDVTKRDGVTTTTVDGEPGDRVPALERFGERYGDSFAVRATRLEGDQWAVRGGAL